MLLDFWAIWCGPCKDMDAELWGNKELAKYSGNFVAVRINVDTDKRTPVKYKAQAIPKVVLVTAGGEPIWEQLGFADEAPYLEILKAIPSDATALNKATEGIEEKKKDPEANFIAGLEFQKSARSIKNQELRDSFLECSKKFLGIAGKLTDDPARSEEIELNQLLNQVYAGSYQRVLKSFEKLAPAVNESLGEFRHYILAECYKRSNDEAAFRKEKEMIKDKKYLGMLEE